MAPHQRHGRYVRPGPSFAGRPALAVLPFAFLGSDRLLEYAADSLAAELIDGLGRLRWFPIIDRFSSFAFRVDDHPPAHIGKALGARYLVAGKILVDGNRARVTAELRDAENDRLIWSEGYDPETSEFFGRSGRHRRSIVTRSTAGST